MAGVKAAVDIANSGQKVAVLQANDYLGGRLLSTDVDLQAGGNLKFDEGASWEFRLTSNYKISLRC